MGPDFYAILGVTPEADAAQITHAFRALVRTLHPDAAPGAAGPPEPERLAQVLAAWQVLHDPAKRDAYDRTRTPATPKSTGSTDPERDHPDREQPGRVPRTGGDGLLVAGPTRVHDRSSPQPAPAIRVGPPIRLSD